MSRFGWRIFNRRKIRSPSLIIDSRNASVTGFDGPSKVEASEPSTWYER